MAPNVFPIAISLWDEHEKESADVWLHSSEYGTGRPSEDSPHASQELYKSSIAEGQGGDDVGFGDTTGLEVDGGQDKGGQGEGAEAERGGIGDFAVLDGLVQARLELTTKGREASIVATVRMSERITIVVVALSRLGIVAGAVGICAGGMYVFFDVCVGHFGGF